MKVWHITPDVVYADWSVEKLKYSFEHARKDFGEIET